MRLSVGRGVEWLGDHLPGQRRIPLGDDGTMRRGIWWRIRYADLRNAVFPHRLYTPQQPAVPEPVMEWRWRKRTLFTRPWPAGYRRKVSNQERGQNT